MEGEGYLEFSLGCLPQVVRGSRREGLTFPLILQVLDSTNGSRYSYSSGTGRASNPPRKIITVSDGFYSKVDCFWLEGSQNIELYSIIKVQNIDFEHSFQRERDLPRIAGMILDFTVIKKGSEIGFFSGKPVKLRDRDNGRGAETHLLQDSLSQKLWKQVKEERFCDVTFSFPNAAGKQGQVVKAQKNALIANSPVFEAQFEGGFADASSATVPIEDTEPKYMRCLLQFIFTRFVPLLSLRQAFEMLYLARKYLIDDLENYCKNFILNNKQTLAGVTNVFLYLEMNVKACDDDISQFIWAQLRSKANVFIRQPRFNEIDFNTLESFLSEPELNCHEWELAQALRRWVKANEYVVKCDTDTEAMCPHQLLEAIRWKSVPLKEAVMVASWPEFRVQELDPSFLSDQLERTGSPLSHYKSVTDLVNKQYSDNRLHCTRDDFVIYTTLTVNPQNLQVNCLHGTKAHRDTVRDTHCESMGPPFEISNYYIVPSYGMRSKGSRGVEVMVNLACNGKSFAAVSDYRFNSSRFKVQVTLIVFSFSRTVPARTLTQVLDFLPDRDSHHLLCLGFPQQELHGAFLYDVGGGQLCLDLQLDFSTDLSHLSEAETIGLNPSLMRAARCNERRVVGSAYCDYRRNRGEERDWERDYRSISSVGHSVQRLRMRCREIREFNRWQDGWGDVARSPQSHRAQRGSPGEGQEGSWVEVDQPGFSRPLDNTIEIRSPEYADQSEAFGDITRSPQSPDWRQNSRSPSYSPDAISGPDPFQPVRDSPLSPVYPDNGEYFEGVWDDPQEENRSRRHQITLSPPAAVSPQPPFVTLGLQSLDRREPSPEAGPSHRWPPHHQHKSRDPRKKPRKRDGHGLVTDSFHNAIYPRVRRSPSLSPRRELASPQSPELPYSPRGDSNEAAMGSRPGSPQASPPREPYPHILLVRSPQHRDDDPHSSPLYVPSPPLHEVIDIDLEEMDHPQEARDEGLEDEEEEEAIIDFDSNEDQGDKDNRSLE